MVDRVEDREQLHGLVAVAERREGHDRPDRAVRVLPAVLADAGRVPPDVAGIDVGSVERRGEQQHEAVAAADEYSSTAAIARAARERFAAPDRTLHDWAIESIRHSALAAEPSGVPSSKKARRYQSPSQPSARGARRAPRMCSRQRSARDRSRPRALSDGRERGQRPRTGTSRARRSRRGPTDTVHAVVPVAGSDQRQPVCAEREARDRSPAAQCSNRDAGSPDALGLEVGVVLVGPQRRALDEREQFVQDRRVAG